MPFSFESFHVFCNVFRSLLVNALDGFVCGADTLHIWTYRRQRRLSPMPWLAAALEVHVFPSPSQKLFTKKKTTLQNPTIGLKRRRWETCER